METPGSESRSHLGKRKPLVDLTNSIPSSSFLKFRSSKPAPNHDEILSRYETSSTGSGKPENPKELTVDPACTPRAKVPSANSDIVDGGRSEVSTNYTRQSAKRRKNAGKAVATGMQLSCPPLGRTSNFGSLNPALKQKPSLPTPNHDEILPRYDTRSTGSSKPENPKELMVDPACTPGAKVPSASSVDMVDGGRSEVSITYTRQSAERRKNTGKAVATGMQLSCPPLGRTINFGAKMKTGHEANVQPKPCSVPIQKSRKKRLYKMTKDVDTAPLPQDFIEKQKAYFAEIDAFQLPEEVVSESELD